MENKNINKLIRKLEKLTVTDGWGYKVLEADWDGFKKWLKKELKDLD